MPRPKGIATSDAPVARNQAEADRLTAESLPNGHAVGGLTPWIAPPAVDTQVDDAGAARAGPAQIAVDVPLSAPVKLGFCLRVDCKFTVEQSEILHRVASELDRRRARLNSGRRVVNSTEALKYLLELIGHVANSQPAESPAAGEG